MTPERLCDFVRRTRREKNLSLEAVSNRSARFGPRITASYINRIENDPARRVTADRLKALANGLGVPIHELLTCAVGITVSKNTDPPYRIDLINAAMGAQRLSNTAVARMAGVGPMTVSKIRNGYMNVGYMTLKKVVEAVGLTMTEVSTPKESST